MWTVCPGSNVDRQFKISTIVQGEFYARGLYFCQEIHLDFISRNC
jgi:hypothetical protein